MQGTFGLNLGHLELVRARAAEPRPTNNGQRPTATSGQGGGREMPMRPDRIPFAVLDARDRALTVACGLASFSPSLVPFEPEPTVGGAKRACVARGSSSSASRHRIRARSPVVRIGSTPYVYVGLSVRKIRGGSAWPSRDQLVASSSIIQIQSGCEILPKLTLNSQRLLPATQIKKILEQPWLTTTP